MLRHKVVFYEINLSIEAQWHGTYCPLTQYTMNHSIVFFLLAFLTSSALATQPDPFSKWTPKGWKRTALAVGDLNADGVDDVAIVLDQTSRSKKAARLPPRRMLVLLGDSAGYKKLLSRDDLLPSAQQEEGSCWIDPLLEPDAVTIKAGVLTLAFREGVSCGSYDISNEQFVFHLEAERLRLTSYDLFVASRSSGEIEEMLVDFRQATLRRSYGRNLFDESQQARVRWEQLLNPLPMYLDDMSLNCDPEKVDDLQNWCE